jgi:hypothetical protein
LRLLTFILAASLLISCKKTDPTAEFNTYLGSIETLKLPADINSIKPSANYDTTLFKKFRHSDAKKPCAKLPISDTVFLIVEQMNFSEENMIRTVSTTGRQLDMKPLFAKKEDCSSDYGFSCSRNISINSDNSIMVIDSVRQSDINANGGIVEDSEQLRVSQRKWEIDGSGHFIAGKVVNVDSAILSRMALGMKGTLSDLVSQNYPAITDTAAFHFKVYFVDLDSRKPNVIVSFTFDEDGATHEASDVVLVYFTQKRGKWSIENTEMVPLSSLDN